MIETRERLEAAVRATWSYDDLVVYADHLQGEGDVRGELIALDLAAPADRYSAAATGWRDRRHALVVAWVGRALADEVGEALELGFFRKLDERASPALLASPAGAFIRAFEPTESADAEAVYLAVHGLAAAPRPWLTRLKIAVTVDREIPFLVDQVIRDLIEMTPNLALLELAGPRIASDFPHPGVRYLRITNAGALGALVGEGTASLPAVTHLDLCVLPTTPELLATLALTRELFPRLVSLDLSRNPTESEGVELSQPELFAFVRAQPILPQLRHLELPALRDQVAVTAVARLLDHMPELVTAKVARTYGAERFGAELADRPLPVIVPTAFPWPPPETLKAYNSLVVRIPDEPYDDIIALPGLLTFLERHFAGFSDVARAAWIALWDSVRPADEYAFDDEEPPPLRGPLALATVIAAVDACDALTSDESRSWAKFRSHFRHACGSLTPDTEITMSIYRG